MFIISFSFSLFFFLFFLFFLSITIFIFIKNILSQHHNFKTHHSLHSSATSQWAFHGTARPRRCLSTIWTSAMRSTGCWCTPTARTSTSRWRWRKFRLCSAFAFPMRLRTEQSSTCRRPSTRWSSTASARRRWLGKDAKTRRTTSASRAARTPLAWVAASRAKKSATKGISSQSQSTGISSATAEQAVSAARASASSAESSPVTLSVRWSPIRWSSTSSAAESKRATNLFRLSKGCKLSEEWSGERIAGRLSILFDIQLFLNF